MFFSVLHNYATTYPIPTSIGPFSSPPLVTFSYPRNYLHARRGMWLWISLWFPMNTFFGYPLYHPQVCWRNCPPSRENLLAFFVRFSLSHQRTEIDYDHFRSFQLQPSLLFTRSQRTAPLHRGNSISPLFQLFLHGTLHTLIPSCCFSTHMSFVFFGFHSACLHAGTPYNLP